MRQKSSVAEIITAINTTVMVVGVTYVLFKANTVLSKVSSMFGGN